MKPVNLRLVLLLLCWGCSDRAGTSDPGLPDDLTLEGLSFGDLRGPIDGTSPAPDIALSDGLKPKMDLAQQLDAGKPDAPKPGTLKIKNVTLLVNLGDSLAAGYYASSGLSYKALLVKNNDLLYASYKGLDLSTAFPGLKVVDRSKSGAKSGEIAKQATSVGGNPVGHTLVLMSAGGNDFNESVTTMMVPHAVALGATANLKKIVQHFSNQAKFPGQFTLVMLNIYDPTDGMGSIPNTKGLSGFCKTILKFGLVGSIVVANLDVFNAELANFAKTHKLILADNHKNFLGHGFNHNNPLCKFYNAKDPSLWFHNDCAHGNNRGHHEIRRLIWAKLEGK